MVSKARREAGCVSNDRFQRKPRIQEPKECIKPTKPGFLANGRLLHRYCNSVQVTQTPKLEYMFCIKFF